MLSSVRTNLSIAKLTLERDINDMTKTALTENKVANLRKALGNISEALRLLEKEM